jgi:hypothetical protein
MDVKEDYILRPLIDAIRSLPNYNRDISIKLHFNSYYIKPIKIQSELLEKEIKDDPKKIQQVQNKINEIVNNVNLLYFFGKNEFEYDGIRRNNRDGTLQERIKRKDPTKKWDLRTSHLYYYRDMNGNDVEIPSIYDKIMNIETNYNNSINKWRDDQENSNKNQRNTNTNRFTVPGSPHVNVTVVDEIESEGCPSAGKEPTAINNIKDFIDQALIFNPEKNTDCKDLATQKFKQLNEFYNNYKSIHNLGGGKKRKSKRRKTSKKRKLTKRNRK